MFVRSTKKNVEPMPPSSRTRNWENITHLGTMKPFLLFVGTGSLQKRRLRAISFVTIVTKESHQNYILQ